MLQSADSKLIFFLIICEIRLNIDILYLFQLIFMEI